MFAVRVKGDHACFTRPDSKAAPVSYAVPTPSAVRGFLEQIYWHPQISWRVQEIQVIKPGRMMNYRKTELRDVVSGSLARPSPSKRHTQRTWSILTDVEYVFVAYMVTNPGEDNIVKHQDQFRRRLQKGACSGRPYLGVREFTADFSKRECRSDAVPVPWTENLGPMLFDIGYRDGQPTNFVYYQAQIKNGVIEVPQEMYDVRDPR